MDQAENPERQKINVEQDELYAIQPTCALTQLHLVTIDTNMQLCLDSARSSSLFLSNTSFASFIFML